MTTPAPLDHEADRFAAGVVAVTTAERAVVEAALALAEFWQQESGWPRVLGTQQRIEAVVAAVAALEAARAAGRGMSQ